MNVAQYEINAQKLLSQSHADHKKKGGKMKREEPLDDLTRERVSSSIPTCGTSKTQPFLFLNFNVFAPLLKLREGEGQNGSCTNCVRLFCSVFYCQKCSVAFYFVIIRKIFWI